MFDGTYHHQSHPAQQKHSYEYTYTYEARKKHELIPPSAGVALLSSWEKTEKLGGGGGGTGVATASRASRRSVGRSVGQRWSSFRIAARSLFVVFGGALLLWRGAHAPRCPVSPVGGTGEDGQRLPGTTLFCAYSGPCWRDRGTPAALFFRGVCCPAFSFCFAAFFSAARCGRGACVCVLGRRRAVCLCAGGGGVNPPARSPRSRGRGALLLHLALVCLAPPTSRSATPCFVDRKRDLPRVFAASGYVRRAEMGCRPETAGWPRVVAAGRVRLVGASLMAGTMRLEQKAATQGVFLAHSALRAPGRCHPDSARCPAGANERETDATFCRISFRSCAAIICRCHESHRRAGLVASPAGTRLRRPCRRTVCIVGVVEPERAPARNRYTLPPLLVV